MAKRDRNADPSRMADMLGGFVEQLAPVQERCDSVQGILESLLPPTIRGHCRLAGVSGGNVRLVVDSASYMYELQLCKSELLMELQRLCPGAGLRRIQVAMTG